MLYAHDGWFGGGHHWVADGYKTTNRYICKEVDDEEPPVEARNPPAPGGQYFWDYNGGITFLK